MSYFHPPKDDPIWLWLIFFRWVFCSTTNMFDSENKWGLPVGLLTKNSPVSGHSYCSRAGDSDFCPSLFGEFLQGWETLWICRAWFGSRCSSFGEVWFGVRWEWSHEVLLGSKDWWVEREKQLYHHRKTISRWSMEIRRCLSSIRWFVDDSILVGNLSNVHCRGSSVKALTGSGQKRELGWMPFQSSHHGLWNLCLQISFDLWRKDLIFMMPSQGDSTLLLSD